MRIAMFELAAPSECCIYEKLGCFFLCVVLFTRGAMALCGVALRASVWEFIMHIKGGGAFALLKWCASFLSFLELYERVDVDMALAAFQMCGSKCYEAGPPPDTILSMPPPPLPVFLLPRSAIVALSGNHSQPCFAAFMCEPAADGGAIGPRASKGIEYSVEMPGHTSDDTWMFVLATSGVGVLLLGALLALILLKCRK